MSTADLEAAVRSTSGVLAKVTPEQLDASTPCVSWKVRDVINHVVGWTHQFGAVALNGSAPDMSLVEQDYASSDFNGSFAAAGAQLIGAFQAEDALTKPMSLMGGEMPGAFIMGIATTDIFTHGWDLARAIGEPTAAMDQGLASRLLVSARQNISDQMRREEGSGAFFGPKLDVPESAPAADQLAGFLGRQV